MRNIQHLYAYSFVDVGLDTQFVVDRVEVHNQGKDYFVHNLILLGILTHIFDR